ncbi:MAG: CvpA family protein [Endomicrobia bacterium]|nr:CvpA family protein [Endomicrobiia bacterium]MCL2506393.1 CvpA family protein [Endomicrobiia bacterium]
MILLIDIFLIVSIFLIAYLGWSAGLTRSFFAVLTGFLAILAASKYPYQEGINFYLIFVITALAVMLVGGFILRLVNFFYMNIIDKAGGAILSAAVWIIVAVNVLVPTLTHGTHALDEPAQNSVYKTISNKMQSHISVFKDYVPPVLERKAMERQRINEEKQEKK